MSLRMILVLLLLGSSISVAETKADSLTQNIKRSFEDPIFAPDKGHHFMASAFITGFSYYAARQEFNQSEHVANTTAITVSLSVGVAKELYDKFSGNGNPSFMDLVADVAGITVGIVLLNISSE